MCSSSGIAVFGIVSTLILCRQDKAARRCTECNGIRTRNQTGEQVKTCAVGRRIQCYRVTVNIRTVQGDRNVWNTRLAVVLYAVAILVVPDEVTNFSAARRVHRNGYLIHISNVTDEHLVTCHWIYVPNFGHILSDIHCGLIQHRRIGPLEFFLCYIIIIVINKIKYTIAIQITQYITVLRATYPVLSIADKCPRHVVIRG